MSSLIVAKEYIKQIYAKNEAYINPLLKFFMALIVFLLINFKLGYMEQLNSSVIVLVVALFCSFMPTRTMAYLGALFMLLHYYALSPECALVVFAVFAVMFLLFARFAPKETLVILLTPICFMMKIPYVMPIAMGLVGGPASVVSVSFGVIISYLVEYTDANASTIMAMGTETMMTKLRFVLDGLMQNDAMIITIAAFAITLVLVYVIRKTSFDYSWTIAIVVGMFANVVILLLGDLSFDLNYSLGGIIVGTIFSGLICLVVQFFEFHVDYRRTERVQFEDDEYYYYVKAVPKYMVSTPNKKVKRINTNREYSSGAATPSNIRTSHGVTRSSAGSAYTEDIRRK